ncbi:4-oxalocrotonate tautomerase family protein [Streptomyces sp. NPDC015125]|uniref:tautomerase family protein n=1 Tax=Streptomyces sp. NPDC015125 TaxID=3364938 RepID=UPI0036F5DCF8
MPFIDVTLGSGRSPEQVRALIHELTEAAHRAVGAPLANIRVVVREVDPAHWAAGDVTTEERNARKSDAG